MFIDQTPDKQPGCFVAELLPHERTPVLTDSSGATSLISITGGSGVLVKIGANGGKPEMKSVGAGEQYSPQPQVPYVLVAQGNVLKFTYELIKKSA